MGSCSSKSTVINTQTISPNNSLPPDTPLETKGSETQQSQVEPVSHVTFNRPVERVTKERVTPVIEPINSSSAQPVRRNVENFVIVWLDASVDAENEDVKNSKNELQQIVNEIRTFSDANLSIDWIKNIKDEKVFLIISGSLVEKVVSSIENLTQLDTVYVFCANKKEHEKWIKIYRKVKGVFNNISSLCEQLKKDTRKSEHDSIGFNVVGKSVGSDSETNNKQEASFMYAQLFKELLLETEDNSKQELIDYCREQYSDNSSELEIVSEFEREYQESDVIKWYTRETFLYKMVNKALRTQDHLTLYALRLFIRDLHQQLDYLQVESKPQSNKLLLFRGQSMSKSDFEMLQLNIGGLLSVNTFLSTSKEKKIALDFVHQSIGIPDTEAVLFQIDLHPMETSSTPYADIDNFSVYRGIEKEYLFSMGAVFRIESITKIEGEIWCVQLTLTKDNDEQLEQLMSHMRQILQKCTDQCDRFGRLMNEMGLYKQAEQFYKLASDQEDNWRDRGRKLGELGTIYARSKRLDEALACFKEELKIKSEHYAEDDPYLAATYNNIGYIYKGKGELDLALEYYQRSLKINLTNRKQDQESIAVDYSNIGTVFDDQGKLDEALTYYERALDIRLKHLPSTHPDIAASYNNIGYLYDKQGKKEEALCMYEKSLISKLASLPTNHPSIALSHSNIALSLHSLGRHDEALQHAVKAVQISTHAFGAEHQTTQAYQNYANQLRQEMDNT
jgi:tetratricopeptide (TPR) repeat protein